MVVAISLIITNNNLLTQPKILGLQSLRLTLLNALVGEKKMKMTRMQGSGKICIQLMHCTLEIKLKVSKRNYTVD